MRIGKIGVTGRGVSRHRSSGSGSGALPGIAGGAGNTTLSFNGIINDASKSAALSSLATGGTGEIGGGDGGGAGFGAAGGSAKAFGFGNSILSIGNQGAKGAAAGDVNIKNQGSTITTYGDHAVDLDAHSIGGGRGKGGTAMTLTVGEVFATSVAIAGKGGSSGPGGPATIVNDGQVLTYGPKAPGVKAKSVGGSGGFGGTADSTGVTADADTASFGASISIGGDGGSASTGGSVVVQNDGNIGTRGDLAYGVLAQSIGGGGGDGGKAAAVGGGSGMAPPAPLLTHALSKADGATTVAPGSIKINSTEFNAENLDPNQIYNFVGPRVAPNDDQVKSPSATGITISAGVGGSGVAAGSGEAVSVANSGEIATMGAYSMGVVAQSAGGGGGSAGATSSSSAKDRRFTLSLALGGSGGSAGDGRYVRVETDPGSTISTAGIHGTGILAQSVGDGGGVVALSAAANEFGVIKGFGVGVAIGGDGGASGHGGNFGVYHGSGAISTRGTHSPGIFAQSIGGGGGVALVASTEDAKRGALPKIEDRIDLNLSFGGNGVTSGDAGQVAVVLLSVDGVATLAGTVAVNPITLAKTETTILTSRGGIKMADTLRSEATHIFIYETAVDGAALTLSTAADFTGASGGGGVNASLAGHLQDIWEDGSPGFGAAFADLANVTGSAD